MELIILSFQQKSFSSLGAEKPTMGCYVVIEKRYSCSTFVTNEVVMQKKQLIFLLCQEGFKCLALRLFSDFVSFDPHLDFD